MIFPNANDVNLHDFSGSCTAGNNETTVVENKLCVCAPGYEFVTKDQTCGNKILQKALCL